MRTHRFYTDRGTRRQSKSAMVGAGREPTAAAGAVEGAPGCQLTASSPSRPPAPRTVSPRPAANLVRLRQDHDRCVVTAAPSRGRAMGRLRKSWRAGLGAAGLLAGLGTAGWLTGPPLLPVVHAAAAPVAGTTTGDVIRTLARERTLGEDGAGLLKDFAATDPARMVQGRLEGVGELLGGAC